MNAKNLIASTVIIAGVCLMGGTVEALVGCYDKTADCISTNCNSVSQFDKVNHPILSGLGRNIGATFCGQRPITLAPCGNFVVGSICGH